MHWLQVGDSEVADQDLASHLDFFWRDMPMLPSVPTTPLDKKTWLGAVPIDQLLDDRSASLPLAGRMDLGRMGYLQLDLYPSRLFMPTLAGTVQTEVRQVGSTLEVLVDEQVVANYAHWNAGWGPVRPGPLSGACGAALVSRGTKYREIPAAEGLVVRSLFFWQVRLLQPRRGHPLFDDPRVLSGGHVWRVVQPAWKEKLLRLQLCLLDPCRNRRSRRLGQLELYWPLRLPLDDRRTGQDLAAMGHVTNAEGDEIASAQLAVDGQVEQRQIPHLVCVLKMDADGPDVFGLQRRLLPHQLPLVPGRSMLVGFHARLLGC